MAFEYAALGGAIWLIIALVIIALFLFAGTILIGGFFMIIKFFIGMFGYLFSIVGFKAGEKTSNKMVNKVDSTSNKVGRKFK